MKIRCRCAAILLSLLATAVLAGPALARVFIQCPFPLLTQGIDNQGRQLSYDQNDPARSTDPNCRNVNDPDFTAKCKMDLNPVTGQPSGKTINPVFANWSSSPTTFTNYSSHVRCRAITCGDGHVVMGDKSDIYIFGFNDVTGVPPDQILPKGFASATHVAPTFTADQGEELYLTLTNAGMRERPDLVDSHTVHYHGFPNAASVFDGEPVASFGINIGSSLTYYYKNEEPGTYMWHCHVEAAEHMQMGMLGQIYINPKQDGETIDGRTEFAYNDCSTYPLVPPAAGADPMCGETGYDILKPVEITAFDPVFHYDDQTYQPVRFDLMDDTYPMLNGRGYPDTINPNPIYNYGTPFDPASLPSQPVNAVIGDPKTLVVHPGQRVLIRMPSLSTVDFYTVTVLGIPMRVVGEGARLLRGPDPGVPGQFGRDTTYWTNSVTLGGGEAYDVLLDTTGVPTGTYFMYTTNLNSLNNSAEDFGGMMTEIVVKN